MEIFPSPYVRILTIGILWNPTKNSSEGEVAQIVARKTGIGSRDTYHKSEYIVDNSK